MRSSPKAGFLKLPSPEPWFVSAMVMETLARFSSKACLICFSWQIVFVNENGGLFLFDCLLVSFLQGLQGDWRCQDMEFSPWIILDSAYRKAFTVISLALIFLSMMSLSITPTSKVKKLA